MQTTADIVTLDTQCLEKKIHNSISIFLTVLRDEKISIVVGGKVIELIRIM